MKHGKISIIVPVYNAEQFISQCLDSIVNQTYTNLEVIIINDGSTDATGVLCDAYAKKDSRLHVIHKMNEGVSKARNIGFKVSSGDYIQLADADDVLYPTLCEKLVEGMEANNADIVICGFRTTFYENGKCVRAFDLAPEDRVYSIENDLLSEFCMYRESGLMNVSWNKLYKRSIIHEKAVTFPEEIHISDDQFFALQYWAHVTTVCALSDVLYEYRQINKASITAKYHEKFSLYSEQFLDFVRTFYRSHCAANSVHERQAFARIVLRTVCSAFEYVVMHSKETGNVVCKQKVSELIDNAVVKETLPVQLSLPIHYAIMRFFLFNRMVKGCIIFLTLRLHTKRLVRSVPGFIF